MRHRRRRQELIVSSLAGVGRDASGTAGPKVISVRAFDGVAWGDWTNVTVNQVERAPIISSLNPAIHTPRVAAASLFAATDPDGDPITQWDLQDPSAGNGSFTVNGVAQAAGQELI